MNDDAQGCDCGEACPGQAPAPRRTLICDPALIERAAWRSGHGIDDVERVVEAFLTEARLAVEAGEAFDLGMVAPLVSALTR